MFDDDDVAVNEIGLDEVLLSADGLMVGVDMIKLMSTMTTMLLC